MRQEHIADEDVRSPSRKLNDFLNGITKGYEVLT